MKGAVCLAVLLAVTASAGVPRASAEDEFERAPIGYSATTPDNAIEQLQARLDAGQISLAHDPRHGYLKSVLDALRVPVSSQTLVFSKTSLQQRLITPRTPRALYFNDDVYVGSVPGGEVVEVSVADPRLGTVFYTLDQQATEHPRFRRRTDDCLICHGGSQTQGVPGHVIRSVYPDASGQPIFSAGSYRVDHTTPFRQRWGGWYVTGSHGTSTHLGNITYAQRPAGDGPDSSEGLNVSTLVDRCDTALYLSPRSDIVPLMVLAHQTGAHNAITRASFAVRAALHREAALNRDLGEPAGKRWPSTDTVLNTAADRLVACLLFQDEEFPETPLVGSGSFGEEFRSIGPRDAWGRSLRDLDLETRLFRHPCSFLIYTESFDALPEELRILFWKRMDEVLAAGDQDDGRSRLSDDDRVAIREILAATKPGAPAHWAIPSIDE